MCWDGYGAQAITLFAWQIYSDSLMDWGGL